MSCCRYAGEYFGYTFKQRRGAIVTIDVQGQLCAFKVLYILAYNQRRKRMSVIVEEENGDAWLYVNRCHALGLPCLVVACPSPTACRVLGCRYAKGADTVIYERLRDSRDEEERQAKLTTTKVGPPCQLVNATPCSRLLAVVRACVRACVCVCLRAPEFVRLGERWAAHAGVCVPEAGA